MDGMMEDKDEKKVKKMKMDRMIGAVLMAIILPIYGWLLVDPSDMINGRAYHVFHEKTGFWMLVSWLEWLFNLFEFTIGYFVISKSNMRMFDCVDSLRWVFNLIWIIVGIEWIWYPSYEKAERKYGDEWKWQIATSMIWFRLVPFLCCGLAMACCCMCCTFMSCMAMCCGKK